MRIKVPTTLALTASILLIALPSTASAARWQVFNNAGTAVGSVINGLNSAGDAAGIIRTGGRPVANVFRLTQGSFDGRAMCPKIADTPVEHGILRTAVGKFTLGSADGSNPTVRATKVTAGYWVLRHKVNGTWTRVGSMRGGCRGAWAAGAARQLLWRE